MPAFLDPELTGFALCWRFWIVCFRNPRLVRCGSAQHRPDLRRPHFLFPRMHAAPAGTAALPLYSIQAVGSKECGWPSCGCSRQPNSSWCR